ncbi:ATP-dependent protease ATPase subunit HslU [mine drainage metagenome]|uniref:ATP-dependent protease ATPase subunit HslU n=1 Tax=mine drainage metagenome TaxID=410659 RepID=A0A1J5RBY8_9ZZZZ
MPSLLTARALQGLGASGIMSVNSALIRFVYPSRLLGRGFGHNALVVATAFTLGPTIASGILAMGPWPWLFAVNIPFGLIAMGIGLKTLPHTPRAVHAFDFPGALLAASCLGLFILGIGSAAHKASFGLVSTELAAAVLLGWALIHRHADHPAPMLPIDLFRRPVFALSAATSVCSFAVQGLAFVSLPFYFEDILQRTQVETGFFMTPWPLVVAFMAPIGGRLSDRYSAGILGGLGLVLLGLGMSLLATLPAAPSVADIVWRMAICGFGFGFFQTPNIKTLMSSAPPHRSGGASGIVATARLTGQTIGAARAALCFGLAGRDGARLLVDEEAARHLNDEELRSQAVQRVEQHGIVFLDEIDKIASRASMQGADVSRQGVQRDLLPLVEGTTVSTKYGMVKTDHVLFIASGAFHVAKPADLIPELQGRFPIRVELDSLSVDDFVAILTATDASLVKQYQALLATDGVELDFADDGIRRLAEIAHGVNETTENIGARRLHTVIERLLEDVSFHADGAQPRALRVDAAFVDQRLGEIARDEDLTRFVL